MVRAARSAAVVGLAVLLACVCMRAVANAQMSEARSPRSLALAGSDVADPRDPFADNPASGAEPLLRLAASILPFANGLDGALLGEASALYPFDDLDLTALALSRFELDPYSDERLSLGYARSFPLTHDSVTGIRAVHAGARVVYRNERFGDSYAPRTELTADVGVTLPIAAGLTFGASVVSLARFAATNVSPDEPSPRVTSIGLAYRPEANLSLFASAEFQEGRSATLRAGVEAWIARAVVLRAGTETAAGTITGGVGLRFARFQMDASIARHPELGSSLAFGLTYGF